MNSQRRFAPKGGRIESESVACFIGISRFHTLELYIWDISLFLSNLDK